MTALKSTPALKATGIEARCAATGMRMTEQRRVIARVLADSLDHPDVEELYRRCIAVDDKISISTVYRTVKLFEDAGIIERHDFREGRARYEQMPDSNHDHLINLRDGKVIEFTSEEIEKLQAEILSIAVDAGHRGRGLSRDLLLTHLGHLAGRGVRSVFLEVEENNQPARRLYHRAGFAVVGRRERYYRQANGEELNALLMRRDLS